MADEEIVEVEDLEEGFEEVDEELDEGDLDDADIDVDELDEDGIEDDEFAGLGDDDEIADLDDDEEEEDGEEEGEESGTARRPAATVVEEEDEDEDLVTPDDVEADLDTILKDRMVAADDEPDEDEEELEVDDRGDPVDRIQPKRPGEFVCQSCFLVKHPTQLADADRQLCADCV